VAAEIARDLPYFTVHDASHQDALWAIASEIAGNDLQLTPTEAFALGGTFLIHDLGMAIASYPEGEIGIKRLPEWEPVLATVLRRSTGATPSRLHLEDPPAQAVREAIEMILRLRHARRAEELATQPLVQSEDGNRYLIEDSDLRNAFGRPIGLIAHSHWWPVDLLRREFVRDLNAPTGFPPSWTIDLLKVACLLRTADAAHLDKLRAPSLLRLLRDPPRVSNDHWIFQGALDPPRLVGDRLRFTSTQAFVQSMRTLGG
jgi:hypothetical protein